MGKSTGGGLLVVGLREAAQEWIMPNCQTICAQFICIGFVRTREAHFPAALKPHFPVPFCAAPAAFWGFGLMPILRTIWIRLLSPCTCRPRLMPVPPLCCCAACACACTTTRSPCAFDTTPFGTRHRTRQLST